MTGMAQGTTESVSPLSVGSLSQLTLSLLAIVALIFAISWLLKRFKSVLPQGSGDMAVVDQLSIGPRERIALVRVGDQQVLVGIGAGGIVALTPLATPVALTGVTRAPAFAERLRDMMKRSGGRA